MSPRELSLAVNVARVTASLTAALAALGCSAGPGDGPAPDDLDASGGAAIDRTEGSDVEAGVRVDASADAKVIEDARAPVVDAASAIGGSFAVLVKFRKVISLSGGSLGSFNALAGIYSTAQVTTDSTGATTLSSSECHMDITGSGTGGLQGATFEVADVIMTTTHVTPARLTLSNGGAAWALSEVQAPIGWMWSSPSDATPTSATDPRVFDQDMDGMPGVTMHVLWNGTDTPMPFVQTQREKLSGTFGTGGVLSGTTVDTDDVNIIGNTSALAGATVTWDPDPNTADDVVRIVPVASALTCAQLMAQASVLFP
jgi:hypothetical protein